MEFWGVEVKSGEPLKVNVEEGMVIHLSQACLGESKKGKDESVHLYANVNEKKLAFGTLSADKIPQIQYDIVFDKDFELSHTWKNGSVFFAGYSTQNPMEGDDISGDDFSDSEDEELELPNGKPEPSKPVASKPDSAAKAKVKIEDAKAESDDDDSPSDEDLSDSDDSEDGSLGGAVAMDEDEGDSESDSEEDSSDEDDEETPTPKKADNKKRSKEPETKTPVPSKKAKLATPQKTDGKKVAGHVDTPHPNKQAAKTPKTDNAKTPASGSKVSCGTCSKTFNSDKALESHSKAKHSAAK